MRKFIVEALTKDERGMIVDSLWKVDESPDFPQTGDTIYSTGDPLDVERRIHLHIGDQKMVALEVTVPAERYNIIQRNPAWHRTPEQALAA